METNKKIFIVAALVCIIGGLQFSIMKYALMEVESEIMFLWARFLLAYAGIFVFARVKKLKLVKDKYVILLSLVHPMAAFYLQSLGTAISEVTVVSVITALFPAVAAILAFVTREDDLTVKGWFAITGIVIGGLICAVFGKGASNFFTLGALYIFLSILLRGVYYVMGHRLSKRISNFEISYAQITYSFIGYTFIAIFFGEFHPSILLSLSWNGVLSLVYMGVVATAMAYIASNYLLSKISVSMNGSLSAITFVINLFAAAFLSGEELNVWIYAGSAVVIISIVILGREKSKKNKL